MIVVFSLFDALTFSGFLAAYGFKDLSLLEKWAYCG